MQEKQKNEGEKNSRGLKEISQTVILLVWRLGDRPEKRKKRQTKSEQFSSPLGSFAKDDWRGFSVIG